TECFLLPVIQNAIEDSVKFKKRGLTAILVYPMNALANDQEERIQTYLTESGHTHVKVARYDRSTKQDEREALRKNPPHILLTNYMMLEYLLVRPSDRDAIFANHRCRFIVLDEVHTYRGSLGANIALLVRRLKAHLSEASQDWGIDQADARRFPKPVAVGTSATIKSVDETGLTKDQIRERRDAAVQEFFGKLTGYAEKSIYVVGEELRETAVPPEAKWPAEPVVVHPPRHDDPEAVARAMAELAGLPPETPVDQAAKSAAILWKLNDLLVRKPLSISQIVEELREKVPERAGKPEDAVRMEVQAALVTGAALPDGTPGVLRLRTHRFIRGGWSFHRCINPDCGKLFPFSREECDECGTKTAPLYICRSCGSHTLRFKGDPKRPQDSLLQPHDDPSKEDEWFLYYEKDSAVDEEELEADESEQTTGRKQKTQMKSRPVVSGSFEPASGSFSSDPGHYPHAVTLAPARNTCLVCGGSAGSANLLTPVALGTSAAVRVLSEGLVEGLAAQNKGRPKKEYDGKDRLLIFADSRQDAAHQARFITY
ncbi:MAG: DEAD/DEAH box helicase, partial [Deltaproteobacteria bacterium]|nr:DEAD/DEAH box helicase [Deltaproteobacteria bacterium]